MGSTLATLRGYVERQIDLTTTSDTIPSTSAVNDFINKSIRHITRRMKPNNMQNATPVDHAITANTNSVALSATLLYPQIVYYFDASSKARQLIERSLQHMISQQGSNTFFDNMHTGNPSLFAFRGRNIIVNRHFNRTDAAGIKIYGITVPSTLTLDGDQCPLEVDYDMLITYQVTARCYQILDDTENQTKYEILARQLENEIQLDLDYNDAESINLDPSTFSPRYTNFRNPGVFFGES